MSRPVAYTVHATVPSAQIQRAYLAWLIDGHIAEVMAVGAASAQVVSLDTEPGGPMTVEVRYTFADRSALELYLAKHAPRLRAAGGEKFGPDTGVRFQRTVGEIYCHR